jgi:rhodanese-related sulfurtransferase
MHEGAIVVDVRDSAQRATQGPLPGALVIDLTVLEWRLAPSSATRIADIDPDQRVILVCSEGYSSTLAAARLQDLGVSGATDLEGGFTAWSAWQAETAT